MQVQLEKLDAGPDAGRVRFFLREGSSDDFRRALSPYGYRRFRGVRQQHMDFFVPLSSSMAACGALAKSRAEILASKELQVAVRASAWKCTHEKLYPFQRSGAEFLRPRRRAILADQMGLGKSAQSLMALDAKKASLVIVPSVVLGSWYDEARRWRPDLQVTIWKRPYGLFPEPGEVRLVTYPALPAEMVEKRTRCPFCDRLSVVVAEETEEVEADGTRVIVPAKWKNQCLKERSGCGRKFDQREDAYVEHVWAGERPKYPLQVVVDEAHYCKSRKAKRTIIVRGIASQASSLWLLTGTPLLNSPMELWTLCQTFPGPTFGSGAEDVFNSFPHFVKLFHGTKLEPYGGYAWSTAGDVEPEARERLGSLMLRRMREDVLPELPKKTRRFLEVDYDGRGLPTWVTELEGYSDERVLQECAPEGTLSTVRRQLAERKFKALAHLIEEYEEVDEPIVVFSYHKGPIELLAQRKGWAGITGATSDMDRSKLVTAFQAGKLKGIAGTIGAMGVGVTLTAAANMLFLDRDFVPANNLQGEDRVLRIGQKRSVVITVLMTSHPVDRRVRDVLARKERLLESMELGEETVHAEVRFAKGLKVVS